MATIRCIVLHYKYEYNQPEILPPLECNLANMVVEAELWYGPARGKKQNNWSGLIIRLLECTSIRQVNNKNISTSGAFIGLSGTENWKLKTTLILVSQPNQEYHHVFFLLMKQQTNLYTWYFHELSEMHTCADL